MPQPYPNGELVIVIDCSDLDRSARFWAAVLMLGDPDGNEFCVLQPPEHP
jgi:hypothetical protein